MDKVQKLSAAEFYDSIADNYDKQLEKGLLEKIMRNKFHNKLLNDFKPGDNILEISCGTGTDAVYLAKHGIYITATDISGRMIEVTNSKVKKENLFEYVKTITIDTEKIILNSEEKYDGIYSNFDGLNYIDNLNAFVKTISNAFKPGSIAVFTVLNKKCLWEFIYYFLKFHPFKAFNNLREREKNYINKMTLYTPGKFANFFKKDFKIKSITGFGFLIPPDGLTGIQMKFRWLFEKLEKFDVFISSIFPFRNFCDHYIVELEKNGS